MSDYPVLLNILYFLGAALVTVPLAKRIGLGSVLGYLAAGIGIGPSGLGAVAEPEAILHFAEFGVVLLMFLIGLELNPQVLWSLRRSILGSGGTQVVVTAILLGALGYFLHLPWRDALIVGMGLALSSTAIALKSLEENNLLPTALGQSAFSVLLFQDLAVIPMLAILPLLASSSDSPNSEGDWMMVGQALAAIALIVLIGPRLLRPIMRLMAQTGLREIFTAFSLALVIGVALLMHYVGLSMALGTFLVGVLLADSEYRHALEADIEPLKGLLMGLFFLAVGMSVDFGLLLTQPTLILSLTGAILAVKVLVLLPVARLSHLPKAQTLKFSFLLSQGGEFAFVLFTTAVAIGAMSTEWAERMILVVTFSMLTTPLLLWMEEKLIAPRFRVALVPPGDAIEPQESAVIIAGFGRFGQIVGRFLHAHGIPTTLLDHDPEHVEYVKRFRFKVFYGDATRLDLLYAAGADRCRVLVLALDDKVACLKLVETARIHFPHLRILARAWDLPHVFQYQDRGLQEVYRETFDSALALGEGVLRELGYPAFEVHRAGKRFRQHDMQSIQEIYKARKESPERGIDAAIRAREELEQLFARDTQPLRDRDNSWS